MRDRSLQVLLASRSEERAATLHEGLRDAGCAHIMRVADTQKLLRRIIDADPHVIFADIGSPEPEELEEIFQISRAVRRPIAVFVDHSDEETIAEAVAAGIGAYIVDGLRRERVGAILALAVSRFRVFNQLREDVERARQALEERKVVERAKGLLMKDCGIAEEQAYALLRKTAMNENRRLADVAQSLIVAAGLQR